MSLSLSLSLSFISLLFLYSSSLLCVSPSFLSLSSFSCPFLCAKQNMLLVIIISPYMSISRCFSCSCYLSFLVLVISLFRFRSLSLCVCISYLCVFVLLLNCLCSLCRSLLVLTQKCCCCLFEFYVLCARSFFLPFTCLSLSVRLAFLFCFVFFNV